MTEEIPGAMTLHKITIREAAQVRVEQLADGRIRLGLWRRNPTSDDAEVFSLTAGFALPVADARELKSALTMAIHQSEAAEPGSAQ